MIDFPRITTPFFCRSHLFWILPCLLLAALSPASQADEIPLSLDYNFNGMLHPGEAGQPDAEDGFRAISDRALIVDGAAMSLDDVTSPASGLSYDINNSSGALDLVHLGNRNIVDNGNWAFDPVPDGDDVGIQPSWLPDPDQTIVSQPLAQELLLDPASEIGLLYQVSNGGGDFDVTLEFSDNSSVTVTLNGPDWFGPFAGTPDPPGPGVDLQQNLGTDFTGAENVDSGAPGATLIVTEAVITAAALQTDLGFDVDGRILTGLTFDNRSNVIAGYAVLAATALGTIPTPPPGIEIPTLHPIGLVMLAVLMLLAGSRLLRRRRS